MSRVWIGSDFHIGHKNIHKFRNISNGFHRDFENEGEHRQWLMDWVLDNVRKRDTLILLGDICFNEEALSIVGTLPGRKVLVKGNHDLIKHSDYPKVFDQVHGLYRYKHCWLSHAPMHPDELRGKISCHGHTHYYNIDDTRYQNVCVENNMKLFGTPCVPWEDMIEYRKSLIEE